jgi:hypothetical protein
MMAVPRRMLRSADNEKRAGLMASPLMKASSER